MNNELCLKEENEGQERREGEDCYLFIFISFLFYFYVTCFSLIIYSYFCFYPIFILFIPSPLLSPIIIMMMILLLLE